MDDFTTRVYLVVLALARRLFQGDDARVQNAVGNAWYQYQQTPRRLEITATAFAWSACRWEFAGRDIPGTGRTGRNADVLDRHDTWTAGSMEGVHDSEPEPWVIAAWREAWEQATEGLTEEMDRVIEDRLAGVPNNVTAARLGITPGALTQRRQKLAGPYLD